MAAVVAFFLSLILSAMAVSECVRVEKPYANEADNSISELVHQLVNIFL